MANEAFWLMSGVVRMPQYNRAPRTPGLLNAFYAVLATKAIVGVRHPRLGTLAT
jgi:hypothetical protein